MNDGDLNEEFGDVIHNTILEVQMSVGESGELFIFRTIKPFCEEVLSREISKKELKEMLLKAERMKWIPCSERLPEDESYILVSFENSTMPDIAKYEENDEGGASIRETMKYHIQIMDCLSMPGCHFQNHTGRTNR